MAKRLFVAIDLDDPLRKQIDAVIHELRERYAALPSKISWVKPENVHLTLKFLGEIPEESVDAIREELRASAALVPNFKLILNGISNFAPLVDHPIRPRTPYPVWVGAQDTEGRLAPLVQDIERRLEPFGVPPENRPFVPHFTLARVKWLRHSSRFAPGMEPADRERFFGELPVQSLVLFESHLLPEGAIYEKLGEWPFAQATSSRAAG